MDRVRILDTTLRDGEQMPGVNLSREEKLLLAEQLCTLKVDVIEAGFPVSSEEDFLTVREIARKVKGVTVCAMCRAVLSDVTRTWEAICEAEKPRIHIVLAASDLHLQSKLKITRERALEMTRETVSYAKSLCEDVQFSPEDASRADPAYLAKMCQTAIACGATVINIPDTVGYSTPSEFKALIETLYQNVPDLSKVCLSVHCHDDLGLATANTLAGVRAGARQVECTLNGMGERAGNACMEEIVMGLKTRSDYYGGLYTGIDTTRFIYTSGLLARISGVRVAPNKAVVGENAFRHESGIHQHGILSNPMTYQILTPESVGLKQSSIVLGRQSGRHAFEERLHELGYFPDAESLGELFDKFKELALKKKEITDRDLEALAQNDVMQVPSFYKLEYFLVTTGNTVLSTATVRVSHEGQAVSEAACGDGPIHAAFAALARATGVELELMKYEIRSVTGGEDALGEVSIRTKLNGQLVTGLGVSTDIFEASALAYVNAVNRSLYQNRE